MEEQHFGTIKCSDERPRKIRWGERRYQKDNGALTEEAKERYFQKNTRSEQEEKDTGAK